MLVALVNPLLYLAVELNPLHLRFCIGSFAPLHCLGWRHAQYGTFVDYLTGCWACVAGASGWKFVFYGRRQFSQEEWQRVNPLHQHLQHQLNCLAFTHRSCWTCPAAVHTLAGGCAGARRYAAGSAGVLSVARRGNDLEIPPVFTSCVWKETFFILQ